MSDADCTPGREPRSVATSFVCNGMFWWILSGISWKSGGTICTGVPHSKLWWGLDHHAPFATYTQVCVVFMVFYCCFIVVLVVRHLTSILLQADYEVVRSSGACRVLTVGLDDDSFESSDSYSVPPPPAVKGPAVMTEEQIMAAFRQYFLHSMLLFLCTATSELFSILH